MSNDDDPHSHRAKSRLGAVLRDKWQLEKLLGVGGMASVYAATHRNGKRAAVKILHPEAALHSGVKARFLREGYVANKVDHPGAVSVLDDDVAEDGSPFLVMELLEGETLEARWSSLGKQLACGDVLKIADQVLDVLAAAHAKAIVHRDMKPGNLFMTRDGGVKVLDFGIARLGDFSSSNSSTTSFSSSMGTVGFMPPEQARGRWEQVDARTDLWALGATMYTLLSGRYVHEAATTNEQLLAAMTKQAAHVQSVAPEVPDAVARVVDRALAYESAARWPDARAMQTAVREAYASITGSPIMSLPRLARISIVSEDEVATGAPTLLASATPSGPASTPTLDPRATTAKPARRLRASWLAGGAVTAAAVVALVALAAFRSHDTARPASEGTPSATAQAAEMRPDPELAIPPTPIDRATPEVSASIAEPRATARPAGRASTSAHAASQAPSAMAPPVSAATPPPPTPTPAASVDIFGRRR